jgi:hypothetical protein
LEVTRAKLQLHLLVRVEKYQVRVSTISSTTNIKPPRTIVNPRVIASQVEKGKITAIPPETHSQFQTSVAILPQSPTTPPKKL